MNESTKEIINQAILIVFSMTFMIMGIKLYESNVTSLWNPILMILASTFLIKFYDIEIKNLIRKRKKLKALNNNN